MRSSPAGTSRIRSSRSSARATTGSTLAYAIEDEPLGTGGAIGFAGRELEGSFFALNGDSLREADLGELVEFHRSTGAKATILLTPVADPSRYGLVRTAADGRVETFLEKPRPEEIDTDLINAGLYVLEPEVLELVAPGRAVSIEREVFPRLAAEGSVYGVALPGYWLDVGTPESYLQAHRDVLERIFQTEVGDALGSDFTLVDPTATISPSAKLVPPVYVGAHATVGERARLGSLARPRRGSDAGRGLRSSRTPWWERVRASAREPASSARSSATGSSSAPPASSRASPSSGPARWSATGTSSTTGSGSARGQRIPDEALRFS